MRTYILRRLLLIPVTLLGLTLLVFFITRIVPGGPIERAMAEMQQMSMEGGRSAGDSRHGTTLSEDQLATLRAYYGFDRPFLSAYFHWMGNVLRGDLGNSFRYQESVMTLILERIPISLYYGLIALVLTYAVCIPLGIVKAIRHKTTFDTASSIIVFIGYAVPGYVLGTLLLVIFAARLEWFPMSGFVSPNFSDMNFFEKTWNLIHHSILPLICYMIGSFAVTTMLMKNNLMDNIAADYVRTAVAKGLSFKDAIFKHAVRNSLIPIASTFGQNITLVIGGSYLIEFIFDIDGMGLLGYEALLNRDFPIVLGVLLISSFLLLIGNIISDILVAIIDPRIRFK